MTQAPQGTIRMNLNVDEKLHATFKAAVALEGKRMSDVLIEFMKGYVREHMPTGFPRKAGKK
jgi:hypothetical protein